MIYTSYFANLRNIPNTITPIAICGKAPDWYKGLQYKKLAPKYSFFSKWKENKDNGYYTTEFFKQVLCQLDINDTVSELLSMSPTQDIALICYEKPSDFCHRHLVSKWLNYNGILCTEFVKKQ